MKLFRILPLIAACCAVSPAAATTTFLDVGADTGNALIFNGGPLTFQSGPHTVVTSYAPGVYSSVQNFYTGNSFANTGGRAAGAVRVDSVDRLGFLVQASTSSASLPFTGGASGFLDGSAYYDFAIDTDSVVSLSFLATDPNFTGSDVLARLYRIDGIGLDTYYLNQRVSGSGQFTFDLTPGTYKFYADANASEDLIDNIRLVQNNTDGQSGEFEISINSPAATGPVGSAVPEPASWALMLAGFGAVGGMIRRNKKGAGMRVAFA